MTAQSPGPDAVARDEVGEALIEAVNRLLWRYDNEHGYGVRAFAADLPAEVLPHLTPQPDGPSGSFREKLERSSLGTPEAKAARESTPIEVAREIVRRSNEQRVEGASPDRGATAADLTVLDLGVLRELAETGKLVRANIFLPVLDEVERRRTESLTTAASSCASLPTPHLTPQPDGDVQPSLTRLIRDMVEAGAAWTAVTDAVLASGLVVPVGRRDRAEAQVAAVRRELERWDGYGHGEFNIHMPENLPCSACNLMAAIRAEIRAALDTAPAAWKRPEPTSGVRTAEQHKVPPVNLNNAAPTSPTTDQRIEARQLTGEHVGKVIVLPDGTRGTLRDITVDVTLDLGEGGEWVPGSDVVTLIGGEE